VSDVATEDRNGDFAVDVDDCRGLQGNLGPQGPGGSNGINCWDLNANGVPDLALEDRNGDLTVDVDDCTGLQGNPGNDGLYCWDLNGNGVPDVGTEDRNGDLTVDVGDCTGLQGPAGPSGRSIVATDTNVAAIPITASCTAFPGSDVTITVPGPGVIVVMATVIVRLDHIIGVLDNAWLSVSSPAADCTFTAETSLALVPDVEPTAWYYETVPLLRAFNVAGSGTYTYYLNGMMVAGASVNDSFAASSMIAVYYPT